MRLIVAGDRRAVILRHAADSWGVCERQCESYMALARAELQRAGKEQAPLALATAHHRLETIYREAMARNHYRTALAAAVELAKLHGCYNPQTLFAEVTVERGSEANWIAKLPEAEAVKLYEAMVAAQSTLPAVEWTEPAPVNGARFDPLEGGPA